jgi:putative peptide zinc metalloprotease protein
VVAGMVALDAWLFFDHGLAQSVRATIYAPAVLLLLFAGVVVATGFHEIGHATACRYGGAKPGVVGVGIYIVWPAFYTDVTDAYRLNKRGRLRTDLGGVYFNAIFALVVAAVYFASGFEPLLLLVLIQTFAILQQLLPLLRLDGYYIISDLTGVPDMFARVRPTLASLIPGRKRDPRVEELKPWVRAAVSAYVFTVVPLLVFSAVMMIVQAPRVFTTAYDSLGLRYHDVSVAFGAGNAVAGLAGVIQMAVLVLPWRGSW